MKMSMMTLKAPSKMTLNNFLLLRKRREAELKLKRQINVKMERKLLVLNDLEASITRKKESISLLMRWLTKMMEMSLVRKMKMVFVEKVTNSPKINTMELTSLRRGVSLA